MRYNLEDAKMFIPSRGGRITTSDVLISKTNLGVASDGTTKTIVRIRFGNEYHELFKNHKLVVYLFDDCMAFKTSNSIGFTYSPVRGCKNIGELKISRKDFVQNIEKNAGHYDLHYDKENDAYFLYFNERKKGERK